MVNRNIQMKKKNNDNWENLYPLTLSENVYNNEGINLNNQLEQFGTDLNNQLEQVETDLNNQYQQESTNLNNQLNQVADDLNDSLSLVENDVLNKTKIINNNLTPEYIHLGNMQSFKDGLAKKYCKIAFVGDSITAGGNPVETSDRWVEQWQRVIKQKFPNVEFHFENFGIGGRTLQDFANPDFKSPTNFTEPWAKQSGVAWRKYVQDYKPDLIVLAFGMNPNASNSPSYSMEVIKTFFNVMNKPSFLVLSSLVPNKIWSSTWEKRAEYSREIKTYCLNNNLSFIDIYNKYRVLVDGVDESQRIARSHRNGVGTINDGSLSTTTFNALNGIFVNTIQLNESNRYKITIRGIIPITVSSTNLNVGNTSVVLPNLTGNCRIVIVYNTKLVVYINDVEYFDSDYYGSFKKVPITFGWEEGTGTTTGLSIVNFEFVNVVKSYTQDDIYGIYVDGDITTKVPHGGNGVNHPSSIGYNLIYMPLLQDFIRQFKSDYISEPILSKTYTLNFEGTGTMDYQNIPNEEKIPFLVGILERSDGQLMKQRIDINFTNNDDVTFLKNDEFLIRRSGGFIQIATKTQTVKTGYKFTTNIIS